MAGYQTFNNSHKPLWVTIYNEPGGIKMDWGEVSPRMWRLWGSGPYARLSYYRVRGEWPMHGPTDDVSNFNRLDGPFAHKPYTFIMWHEVAWWTRPCWRTFNYLDRPIWVTICSYPGDQQLDWGEVEPHGHRDWFSGGYGPGTHYRLRAQSTAGGGAFDTDATTTFEAGWGEATVFKDSQGNYAWQIEQNPRGDGPIRPPKEPDVAEMVTPPTG